MAFAASAAVLLTLVIPAMAMALPPGYAYEKVSPAYKGNGEVAGGVALTPGFRASESGDQVIYPADSVFLGAPTFPQVNSYFADRGATTWQNSSVTARLPFMPFAGFDFGSPLPKPLDIQPSGLSADGRFTVLGTDRDPKTGERMPNRIYSVDLISGAIERISPDPVAGDPAVNLGSDTFGNLHVVADRDFSDIFYSTQAQLTADAVAPGIPANQVKLYHYADGEISLASWDTDGSPMSGFTWANEAPSGPNSVSADGSAYWFVVRPAGGIRFEIRRGEVGVQASTFVNQSENTGTAVPAGTANFRGASPDGQRAVFTSPQQLVDGASTGGTNVYLYTDSDDPENDTNLTLISADGEPDDASTLNVVEVWGVSDDARTVYFSTTGKQLVDGEPIEPGQKLYRWHDGTLNYLATVTVQNTTSNLRRPPFGTTPDGRYLMFLSSSPGITTDANGGLVQQYLYDSASDQFSCSSCVEGGVNTAPATLDRSLNFMPISQQRLRWLASDGRVFFETAERLLPQDTNGINDVYTWKQGRLDLISSGRSGSDVRFADASVDGSTAFFVTRDRLTGWDTDGRADLYAARLGGGLPEPVRRPEEPCVGDDCQGAPADPPARLALGSGEYVHSGAGAGSANRCARLERRASRARRGARKAARRQARTAGKARRASTRRAHRMAPRVARLKRRAAGLERRSKKLDRRLRACRRQGR